MPSDPSRGVPSGLPLRPDDVEAEGSSSPLGLGGWTELVREGF